MSADKVIVRDRMFEPLLAAEPSFRPQWEKFTGEWAASDELPHYLLLGDLVIHLTDRIASGKTETFDAIFDVVEAWVCHGDEYVREAAIAGFLEDLQNSGLHKTTKPADFDGWLRPASLNAWNELNKAWEQTSR